MNRDNLKDRRLACSDVLDKLEEEGGRNELKPGLYITPRKDVGKPRGRDGLLIKQEDAHHPRGHAHWPRQSVICVHCVCLLLSNTTPAHPCVFFSFESQFYSSSASLDLSHSSPSFDIVNIGIGWTAQTLQPR